MASVRVVSVVVRIVASVSLGTSVAYATPGFPPWSDANDIPVPRWAKSVAAHGDEASIFRMPNRADSRRGTLTHGARPPLYGAARAPGCNGRWYQIGPFAWVCSDDVELAADDPDASAKRPPLPPPYTDDGLPFHYGFVGPEGAQSFRDLAHAEEETPEADLDPGFAVAITEEQDAHGQRWAKTRHGAWIAIAQLNVVRPPTLRGEVLAAGQPVSVAWVLPDHAATYTDAKGTKTASVRTRFQIVHRHEEEKAPSGMMVRVSDDGAPMVEWMKLKDLARPSVAPPPPPVEVGGALATERWIDVDLATETLVAYEGVRPVYAALVSTGRGAQGTETSTPIGVHRIWVKLQTSSMGNLGDEDADSHYSIEDVPYVQFFAKGVALHGAFWHHSFGFPHSHGCVNLSPIDARWLFDFTAPAMPTGWSAVLPAGAIDPGTLVRVR